ncbi:hypothetical protein GCM10008955_19550 [Deinococcus malanensis]|uniref:YbjN domain-containing protein n=1 Tax=Deinococcus malanensis TaxID=1706855 RepID=A0ABQ2EUS0_9DEIO|nr:hypothetical protein [Deinococcus malanensis]GGK25888.1 hypothetical protein GCM10008955_19550 [Deinococcus malanensis]
MTEKKSAKVARPRPKPAVIREPLSPLAVLKTLLADHGFSVREDPEVGLSFMFEGGQYHLPPQGNDQEFYHLLFPNFWALESDEEYGRALFACDAVNREAKLVKLYTADTDVWAGVEALHASPEAFVAQLPRYLAFVQEAVRAFREVMLATLEEKAEPTGVS